MCEKLVVLWDESQLWGLLFVHALREMEIRFRLVSAAQIRDGLLQEKNPQLLLVPGGWARLKAKALGAEGKKNIQDWVENGGTYFGVCGGAGLGLNSKSGGFLDLCCWQRKTGSGRLPNFSGYVLSKIHTSSQILPLPVWWPSQFAPQDGTDVEVIASYQEPGPDFWVSDLYLPPKQSWEDLQAWEKCYGIKLDPALLQDEPCIIRGRFGNGTYILSYPHLETPDADAANLLLGSLLRQAGIEVPDPARVRSWQPDANLPAKNGRLLNELFEGVTECILLGQRNFLLFWRSQWLLGWRRGIPGSLLSTLFTMTCQALRSSPDLEQELREPVQELVSGWQQYLLQERLALSKAPSSPEASANVVLQEQKLRLFGSFPGYGGLYGQVLHGLDRLIFEDFQPPQQ